MRKVGVLKKNIASFLNYSNKHNAKNRPFSAKLFEEGGGGDFFKGIYEQVMHQVYSIFAAASKSISYTCIEKVSGYDQKCSYAYKRAGLVKKW